MRFKSMVNPVYYFIVALLIVFMIMIKLMKVPERVEKLTPVQPHQLLTVQNPKVFERTTPPKLCKSKHPLLIVVFSLPQNRFNRDLIRDSWKKEALDMYFLVGTSRSDDEQYRTAEESGEHKDMIIVDIMDSQANSSLKSVIMLDLFIDCAKHIFLLKVEDTAFVNPVNVEIEIQRKYLTIDDTLILGNFECYKPTSQDPTSKFFIPVDVYANKDYQYPAGGAYILNRKTILRLHQIATTTPVIVSDDGFLTGICASEDTMSIHKNVYFNNKKFFEINCLLNQALVIFDLTPNEALNYFKVYHHQTSPDYCSYLDFSSFTWFFDTFFRPYFHNSFC